MIHKPIITERTRIINGKEVIDYRVSIGTNAGKKLVYFRKTKEAARAHGNAMYRHYNKLGDIALALTPQRLTDAAAASQILYENTADTTLVDAVSHFITHNAKNNGVTFGKLLDAYLAYLASPSTKLSPNYKCTTRCYANKILEVVDRDIPCFVLTPADIKPVLDETGENSAISYNNIRAAFSRIFTWGIDAGMVQNNPVAGIARKAVCYEEPVFFKAQQVADILNEGAGTKDASRFMPWLILGFFCGIRPAEIGRLNWEAVKWGQSPVIRIEKPKGHTRGCKPRLVTLNETAAAWLSLLRQDSGAFADYVSFCRWRKNLKSYPADAHNAARHTFATMHYAMHEDIQKTAKEMGHGKNVETTLKHYCGLVTIDEAKAFWALRPQYELPRGRL